MDKCNFCGSNISPGTGKIYVKTDGRKFNFCSNKCEKNMINLGRKPASIKWTEEYRNNKASALETAKKSSKK